MTLSIPAGEVITSGEDIPAPFKGKTYPHRSRRRRPRKRPKFFSLRHDLRMQHVHARLARNYGAFNPGVHSLLKLRRESKTTRNVRRIHMSPLKVDISRTDRSTCHCGSLARAARENQIADGIAKTTRKALLRSTLWCLVL